MMAQQYWVQDRSLLQMVQERISATMERGDTVRAQEIISEILEFVFNLWKRGITEDTYNFHNNYGYLASGQLIQVDIGSFWKGAERVKEQMKKQLILQKESFAWLQTHYPGLAVFLQKEFQIRLHKSSLL
jgi:hypothetical protein